MNAPQDLKTVIYERIKAGTFPKPIKLGSASAWPEHEVENWIAQQVEEQRRRRTPQRERLHGELRSGDGVRGLTPNAPHNRQAAAANAADDCPS